MLATMSPSHWVGAPCGKPGAQAMGMDSGALVACRELRLEVWEVQRRGACAPLLNGDDNAHPERLVSQC